MPDSNSLPELTPARLVENSTELVPLIHQYADQGERDRNVPVEVMAALRTGGYFRLLQPRRFGGLEADMADVVRCQLNWAAADASTAWVAGIAMIHPWVIALFPIECQEEVWGDNPDAMISGSYAPAGQCVRDGDGFRLTGSWAYASGCLHGDWGLLGTMIPSAEEGMPPRPGFVLVPANQYTIDKTWDPIGLIATGSHNIVCEDAFVPEYRSVTFAQLASGNAPGYQALQSRLYRYPLLSLIAYAISCPAVGALQGAIDQFIEDTKGRETRGAVVRGGAKVIEYQSVQIRVGAAAGALRAAKAMIFDQLEESRMSVIDRGETLTIGERQDNRITQAYSIDLAVRGLEALWGAAGGAGIQRSQHLQRAWRDAHAVQHHVSFNWDALTSMYGQHLLGLEPQGQY